MRLDSEAYADKCWNEGNEYALKVLADEILVGDYIRLAVARFTKMKNDPRYILRKDKVYKVFKFFSYLNVIHNKEKDKYIQFPLFPWQSFVIIYVFGFYYADNPEKRVVREVFLFVARKNGKTAFSAALQVYGMLADGVENPQSILLANTAQQASIALNFAKNMVIHTPQLNHLLIPQRSKITFKDKKRQGFMQIFSPIEPARLEGYSPNMAILDEVHGYKDNAIYMAIKTGMVAHMNPVLFLISSAGVNINGFLNEYLTYHQNVLKGIIEDETIFSLLYQPDPMDDIDDPNIWIKSNPSLGEIISLEDLIKTYNSVKYNYNDKFYFLTKHLNIFCDTPEIWIPEENLLQIYADFNEENLYGRDVYVGMDLSKTTDLTAVSVFVPAKSEDEKHYVISYFWLPDPEKNMIRKSGKTLEKWFYDGYIYKGGDRVIDHNLIYEKIKFLNEKYNIISIYYDPYNAPILVTRLKEEGFNCVKFQQTALKFNAPLKYIEEQIYNNNIVINNPVLLWNFKNVVLYRDGNDNVKIVKNRQADSVDGCVALAMAVGGYLENLYDEELVALNNYTEAYKKIVNN